MKRILFLVNHSVVIYNFRAELVERFLHDDYQVYISSPEGEGVGKLKAIGCQHIPAEVHRHGKNPFEDISLYRYYKKIISEICPDVVLTYTVKPNILGGMAAKKTGTPYIATITGLGTALEHSGLMQILMKRLYRTALGKASCVVFQNISNRALFVSNKIYNGRMQLLSGSGVNLSKFAYAPYPPEKEANRFLFIGRVMKEKGIIEYLQAAQTVTQIYPEAQFEVAGFIDDDICKLELDRMAKADIVSYLGFQQDVRPLIEKCGAIVLPSYHEGMSNVLLEAASMGRPIIASTIPGCQETFDVGETGLGIKPMDVQSLVDRLLQFIQLPYNMKVEMGRKGRAKMERQFSRDVIVDAYVKEIKSITKEK